MDTLKFAFEILVVGALALPWLAVLMQMFFSSPASENPLDSPHFFLGVLPASARNAVGVAVMVAIGYLLGSAVSRISRNFFNDDLLGRLPTEDQIRSGVYWDEYCSKQLPRDLRLPELVINKKLAADLHLPESTDQERIPAKWLCQQPLEGGAGKPYTFHILVQEMFSLQESELLLYGQDKVDRLKQYYDQVNILRGAALNGMVLFVLCVFGISGNWSVRFSGRPLLQFLTLSPAVIVAWYGAFSLVRHWKRNDVHTHYSDPPLAELLILLLGLTGLVFVIFKAKTARFYLPTCLVAAAFAVVSYGGWWWTEVMYDLQVIHSVPVLQPISQGNKSQNADPP
jgi:hypothetical protein